MTAKPESTLVKRIRKAMEAEGAHTMKTHGSIYSTFGENDIFACYQGHTVVLEVKHPDETYEEQPAQRYRRSLWAKAGARTGLVESVEEALAVMRGEVHERFKNNAMETPRRRS